MQTMIVRIKKLVLRLAIHVFSAAITAVGTLLVLMPFLFLLKWLFGPLPHTDGLPNPIEGWWIWLIVIAWLVLFWKAEPRVNRWLLTRFGLGRKAGLKYGNGDT